MFGSLIGQFMQTGAASETVSEIQAQAGLEEAQARDALQATAEGAADAAGSQQGGGIAGALGGLAGMMGGAAPGGQTSPMVAQVASVVSKKTGLSPSIAQAVVSVALPKILAHFQGGGAEGQGGGGGLLGGLLG